MKGRSIKTAYPLDPEYKAQLQSELDAGGWPFGDVVPDLVWNDLEQEWVLSPAAEAARVAQEATAKENVTRRGRKSAKRGG